MRRLVIVLVLGLWGIMLALLVMRSMESALTPGEMDVARADGNAEWMGVYHQAEKIGYVEQRLHQVADGYELTQRSLLRLNILSTPQRVRLAVRADTASDLSLRRISFELESGVGSLHAEGEVRGGELQLKVRTGAEVTETSIPLGGPVYLPALLRASMSGDALRPGTRSEALVFDPTSLRNDRVSVRVDRREPVPGTDRSAWRVEEEFRGMRSTAWIDDDGTVLREEGPMGLVLVREPREMALREGWGTDAALDLMAKVAVPVHPPIEHPRRSTFLRLRVQGIDLGEVPTDDEQELVGDVLSVRRLPVDEKGSYPLPYTGEEHLDHLRATPFLQSDHARIRALAAEILGEETDALRATRLLSDWVYTALRKVPTVSVPNALQVLDMQAGDCNEHAVLFAALARAAGLPARVIAGAVYLDGAFLYHAWAEVWLGRWVSVDPVLDQVPADATHLKFVVGGPEEHFAMMGIIGRLRLELLDSDSREDPSSALHG